MNLKLCPIYEEVKETGRNLTQSYDKSLYTSRILWIFSYIVNLNLFIELYVHHKINKKLILHKNNVCKMQEKIE